MPKSLPVIDLSAPVCCAPLSAGVMEPAAALEVALRLKALADPVRVRLVSLLLSHADVGLCTCDLAPTLGLTEATVSHHLRLLREAGLVAGERVGSNVFYTLRADALAALVRTLEPAEPADRP